MTATLFIYLILHLRYFALITSTIAILIKIKGRSHTLAAQGNFCSRFKRAEAFSADTPFD
ncbi:hypothetical protein [Rhizobium sp. Leaf341]|uniref:hypothetical protein n=1 Tax=Rhizobium sp. Leaf341 TaxID=1736344 RepID=UPI0012E3EB22|nr:hypothetical protein [Rhizobium sp. Leaf341]